MTLVKFVGTDNVTKEVRTTYDASIANKWKDEGIKVEQVYEPLGMYDPRHPSNVARKEYEARRYKEWDSNRNAYVWRTRKA